MAELLKVRRTWVVKGRIDGQVEGAFVVDFQTKKAAMLCITEWLKEV